MKLVYLVLLGLVISSTAPAQSFNGTYTVDANSPVTTTNYQSLAALADSINLHGVSGPVQINVVSGSGPYSEQVWFRNIPGMDAFNSITLDGNGETFSAVTSTTSRHVLRVEGVSYFTIIDFVINYDTNSTGGFYGVHVYNSADHVTVSNCTVNMVGNSTLHGGIICSGSETSILDDGDFHNILITGNTTTGAGYGASVFGEAANLSTNVVISNNTFYDWHSNGVYLRETNGVLVDNNVLDKRDVMISSANAIQLAQAANINGVISNNVIRVTQTNNGTMRIRGIYLFNGAGHKVFNNLIHQVQLTAGNFTGIEIRTGGTSPAISFNTILLDNPDASTGDLAGIAEELSGTNSVLRNNLVSLTQTTSGTKTALMIGATSSPATALNSNFNILYAPGGQTCIKNALTPTNYTSLATWQSASGQDQNSWAVDPIPVAGIPTNATLDNKGINVQGITMDIAGNPRAFTPDIGAYEFLTVGLNDVNQLSFSVYPSPAKDFIQLNCENIQGSKTCSIYSVTGTLVSEQTIDQTNFSLDISGISPGNYFLRLTNNTGDSGTVRFVKE